jgi:hypothetical protein
MPQSISFIVSSAKAQPKDVIYANETPNSCIAHSVGQLQPVQQGTSQVHWDCETRDWGSLKFSADLSPSDAHRANSTRSGTNLDQLTVRQQGELLTNGQRIENTFGTFSSHTDTPINDNVRFRLPASQTIGMLSRIDNSSDSFVVSTGRLIGSEGPIDGAETENVYLSGLGYTHKPNNNWSIGGHMFNLMGHSSVEDHQSLVGVIQYQPQGNVNRYQLHTLSDSDGHLGLWVDAESRYGDWLQQYGAYLREPGLLWTDVEIDNDGRGYYFTSALQRRRYDFALGADWRQSNLEGDSSHADEYSINTFLNAGYQVQPNTRLQGGFTVEDQTPVEAAASMASRCYQLNSGIIQDTRFGTTDLSVSKAITFLKTDRKESEQIDVSHAWQPRPRLHVKGTLSAERETEQNAQIEGLSVGLDLKHEYRENLTWSGKLALYDNRGAAPEQEIDVTFKYLWD